MSRWENIKPEAISNIKTASEAAGQGGFYVRMGERHETGPCGDEYHDTFVFNDAKDFVEFIKFCKLPFIAADETGVEITGAIGKIEDYESGTDKKRFEEFKAIDLALDGLLCSGSIDLNKLETLQKKFNEYLNVKNPFYWIIAFGGINEVISFMADFDDFGAAREEDEIKENNELETVKLAKAGKIDVNNTAHLALAKEFFEERVCA
ncbi:MAG TPA: hypothetical protein PKJ42_07715 [Candidatus Goldiibacteriota bacterium]|nr:hypothetical protein [Candidatus Goldiibacteriota bacterium]